MSKCTVGDVAGTYTRRLLPPTCRGRSLEPWHRVGSAASSSSSSGHPRDLPPADCIRRCVEQGRRPQSSRLSCVCAWPCLGCVPSAKPLFRLADWSQVCLLTVALENEFPLLGGTFRALVAVAARRSCQAQQASAPVGLPTHAASPRRPHGFALFGQPWSTRPPARPSVYFAEQQHAPKKGRCALQRETSLLGDAPACSRLHACIRFSFVLHPLTVVSCRELSLCSA